MEYKMKYNSKICIDEIEFVSEEDAQKFSDDFDEIYCVFMVKLGNLLDEYGVKKVETELSPYYLSNRQPMI